MQQHPALSFENFVGQFDDESVGENKVAQCLNVEQVFHLHTRFTVLAEDGIGDGCGPRDARTTMDENLCPFGKLTGKVEDTLHVLKTRGLRMAWIAGVRKKAEKMISRWSDVHDLVSAGGVVEGTFVPN